MARIISRSGSTAVLVSKLNTKKTAQLRSYDDIKHFKDNFPQILPDKENEESEYFYLFG